MKNEFEQKKKKQNVYSIVENEIDIYVLGEALLLCHYCYIHSFNEILERSNMCFRSHLLFCGTVIYNLNKYSHWEFIIFDFPVSFTKLD